MQKEPIEVTFKVTHLLEVSVVANLHEAKASLLFCKIPFLNMLLQELPDTPPNAGVSLPATGRGGVTQPLHHDNSQ
jgi:hypothetical protein